MERRPWAVPNLLVTLYSRPPVQTVVSHREYVRGGVCVMLIVAYLSCDIGLWGGTVKLYKAYLLSWVLC